jgi:hypothetical protein
LEQEKEMRKREGGRERDGREVHKDEGREER